ncbi:TUBGCP2 [Lepeophtheirus salmonis]|uniref:Gamma-tubulin complex component n=1 Tax=Lepeophtheirus salmonis TaxID=72036 RepID=A0A7R8H3H0_LEPSM|nr:TUBGCP2 [Lepeophtheirus salmonis]CAF2844006.1 TUBGCP2 [Lepeophtheirus salmonis]
MKDILHYSSSPSEFLNRFNELTRGSSTSENVVLLQILRNLRHFSSSPTASFKSSTKSDLKVLKERLEQQFNASHLHKSDLGSEKCQKFFSGRPHLTHDFVPSNTSDSLSFGSLSSIPIESQDNAIVKDLLCCLVGIPGIHIVPKFHPRNGRVEFFSINESCDTTLRELVNRITPLCLHYSTVVRFAENKSTANSGRVNQALSGAINSFLKDYYIFIAQLESQVDLTLNKLWFHLQSTMQTLSTLAEVFVIHNGRGDALKNIGEFLVERASKPFFETLNNEVIERLMLPLEYSDDYWEKRYSLNVNYAPNFLHQHIDKILRTGKYLNVIQQCDRTTQWPEKIKTIEYRSSPEYYITPLESAYAFASKTLLDLLVKDRDLIGHLRSVKHYFLLDQGDFIVQFMDLCEDELLQNVNQVEPARLESLLELALRTSGANADPYKDNVVIELLPYDLIYQMCRILSIDTESEIEFKEPVATQEINGIRSICIWVRCTMANFLILEPNWEDLISKIKSGKVTNVDQVLQIHSDFLTTCLNDCLLSSPTLLTTIKKLLGICVSFSKFMNAISDPEDLEVDVRNFEDDVNKFDLGFTSMLLSLLDKIAHIGRKNYNERILNNILYRFGL